MMRFVPDDGGKLKLLQSISARPRPDAPFVLLDLRGDESSDRLARFMAAGRSRLIALGMATEEAGKVLRCVPSDVYFVPERGRRRA